MKDLLLNSNHSDLVIQNYDLQIVDGSEQIKQNLAIRLRFFLGEWYLNIDEGIPYYQDILIKSPNRTRVESIFKETIINTLGVSQILSFESDFNAIQRKYSVKFQAETDLGIIQVGVNLL